MPNFSPSEYNRTYGVGTSAERQHNVLHGTFPKLLMSTLRGGKINNE